MKRALVTGGASPLGAAISRRLAADGLHVLVHANAEAARAATPVADIRASGGFAELLVCDPADFTATKATLASVVATGVPQIVVHSAGTHDDVPMAGMSEAQWRGVVDVSLGGFFAAVQPLLLDMMATRWGRVVSVSSASALLGKRGQVKYAAAKAGLIGAVKSLAHEVAGRGLTVNAVAPGVRASPVVDATTDAAGIAAPVPMKRAGHPRGWPRRLRFWYLIEPPMSQAR
jgi:3-oxoacyl-[acyl-carrier protein] reductase